ncbi:precorrin-3B synthase [Kribbella sp. NPDC051770]|uniref:precorrin-3B synthase n=1 Tax=Kribbella sp. NPDC051770 TaxID=3155413 RepID=UPI00342951F5
MASGGRSQPDRCPGVLSVHQAADGGLARVRLPGGVLTPPQLRVLAEASRDLGDGNLELTSRGNVQIRALRAPEELSDRLYDAGLLPSISHERVRNILASPLSGLDGSYDVQPLVAELDRALCASPRLAGLPGRFLFALDDGRGDLAAIEADAGVRVVGEQLALLLAGADTGVRLAPPEAPEALLRVAEAFLEERDGEWRLSELADGVEKVLSRLGYSRSSQQLVSGREPVPAGLYGPDLLVATVPLGVLKQEQAAVLAEADQLRVTPWRSVVVLSGDAEKLQEHGLVIDGDSPWNRVTACAGKPGCAKALADVRADARRITPLMRKGRRQVHWSGCERRCGQPAGEFVDVLAVADGYSVDGSQAVSAEQSVMRMR